ncbi:ABC transporter permease [Veronia nyctiphanis]|uniref:ABC transporter permease n=1 Tax=Veronia nyctiphanis TaxID=1278244 RepID=UPI002E26F46F
MSVTLVAAAVVSISLLVGGIGVMNIMLVSVTERTKEIGIAKSLGAPSGLILLQFLLEAVMLSVFGCILGVVLGAGLSSFALLIPGTDSINIPMWSIWLSVGFTTFIGVAFGLAPAMKASKLNPVAALRFE